MITYIRALLSSSSTYLNRIIMVASVLFIVIGLFIQWGFPKRSNSTLSLAQMSQIREEKLLNTFKKPEFQTKSGKNFVALQKRVNCSLIGSLCTNDPKDQPKNFSKSLFGYASNIFILPFINPPASGLAYFQQSIQDAGFISRANAAEGIGFSSLRSYIGVWKAFRNMAYMILVILVIILGFMIMFQYKIDSHTIISVQNSLPRIVVTLLVITFSYAIAGLLVDLTYVIILLIFQIFSSSNLPGMSPVELQNRYLTANILSFWGGHDFTQLTGQIYFKALTNIFFLLPGWIQLSIGSVSTLATTFVGLRLANNNVTMAKALFGHFNVNLGFLGSANAGVDIGSLIGAFFTLIIGALTSAALIYMGLVALMIVGVILLYFRIVFLLIGAYIQIIINVMFAPFFLITEIIPGQSSFMGWIKKLVGNLAVFPCVITLILVIQVVQGIGFTTGTNPFAMPLLYGFDTDVLAMLISGAMLFAIPNIVKDIVKRIAGEPAVKGGAGLLLGGAGVLVGSAMGAASQLHTLSKLTGGNGELPGIDNIKKWVTGKMKSNSGHGAGATPVAHSPGE